TERGMHDQLPRLHLGPQSAGNFVPVNVSRAVSAQWCSFGDGHVRKPAYEFAVLCDFSGAIGAGLHVNYSLADTLRGQPMLLLLLGLCPRHECPEFLTANMFIQVTFHALKVPVIL